MLKEFFKTINAAPTNPQRLEGSSRAFGKIMLKYFFKPHPWAVAFIMIVGSITGGLNLFAYAWVGKYIADDIIEVHLLAQDTPSAARLDPTRIDENRAFALDQQNSQTSWTHRHEIKPGKTADQKLKLLGGVSLLLFAIIIADHFGIYLLILNQIRLGFGVRYKIKHRLYEKLCALPMSYHDTHAVGAQMTSLFSDTMVIDRSTMILMRHSLKVLLTILVGLVVMYVIDWRLATIVSVAMPLYLISYVWFHRRMRVVHGNLRERQGQLEAHISNRITNFYLVKAFVRENFEALVFHRKSRKIINESVATSMLGSLFGIACGILSGICVAVVLWIGGLMVRDGQMSLGSLLMFYTSAGYMFYPVSGVTQLVGVYHRLCAACSKVVSVLEEPLAITNPASPKPLPQSAPEIRFSQVTMKYDPKRPAVIDKFDLTIPSGKSVCVMGSSGSGKTTLAKLACRMYDPTEGNVTFNGIPLGQFRLDALHRFTGYVTQDPVVFGGTIEQNIGYGTEGWLFTDIEKAANTAQIHDFISKLPNQYETLTTERGMTMSGGQKQRVNLARTLLQNPKVLILDDCTSALDAETESNLVKCFDTVLQDKTALLVSHRISIAAQCDYVLILEEGKVTEFGAPDLLLKDPESKFTALKKQQIKESGSFLEIT